MKARYNIATDSERAGEPKVVASSDRCGAITRVLVATFHACLSLASPATQVLAYGLPAWVRAAIGAAIVAAAAYAITSTS
jgi:hypothetical protein